MPPPALRPRKSLRILFVDDDPRILEGLQRMLRPLRDEWEMEFVCDGRIALERMAIAAADVLVSDMRMPVMDGAELLTAVMRAHPSTIRIILSGQADEDLVRRTVGPTHQYLSKPCDPAVLKATIARALHLRSLLPDRAMRTLAGGLDGLPSLPALYRELSLLLRDPAATVEQVGRLIAQDLGMTARILQLVNSSFFGFRHRISNIGEAVGALGMAAIGSLMLSNHAFSSLVVPGGTAFAADDLWRHSWDVSRLARRISVIERAAPLLIDDACMAGMLHDLGRLVLAAKMPREFAAIHERSAQGEAESAAELSVLGATHGDVGGYLLGLWGIAEPVIEAVAHHHRPDACPGDRFSPLTAVHAANALCHAAAGRRNDGSLDASYLNRVGAQGRVGDWVRLAGERTSAEAVRS